MATNNKKPDAVEEAVATVKDPATQMVKLRLPRTKSDYEDQVVCVNNHDFIIKRGVEVEVPRYIATALQEREQMYETIMLFNDANESK